MGWSETEATGRATRLQDALSERTYLADLASRPLLLTLMATLHASYGQLPEAAKHYISYIEQKTATSISMVSVGYRRDQIITLIDPFSVKN